MQLLYFILCAYGMTQILVYGKVFEPLRPPKEKLGGFFHCPMCLGFWVGVFLFFLNPFTELFSFGMNLSNCFLLGCLSSGTSYMLCMLFDDNGLRVGKKK